MNGVEHMDDFSLGTIIPFIDTQLVGYYEKEERNGILPYLLEYLGISKIQLIAEPDRILSAEDQRFIKDSIVRLKKYEPIQYIVGYVDFCGVRIAVNPSVLIPRPETEELVRLINSSHRKDENIKILDIGTGSGCIPIALSKMYVNAEIYAIEVSKEALSTAQENAKNNNADISMHLLDILEYAQGDGKDPQLPRFDVIVSNPPYVLKQEKEMMQKNVLENEPHLALFVDNGNPLLYYDVISIYAQEKLSDGGYLYFEINEAYGYETVKMLHAKEFIDVSLLKDFRGKDRFVVAKKKL